MGQSHRRHDFRRRFRTLAQDGEQSRHLIAFLIGRQRERLQDDIQHERDERRAFARRGTLSDSFIVAVLMRMNQAFHGNVSE